MTVIRGPQRPPRKTPGRSLPRDIILCAKPGQTITKADREAVAAFAAMLEKSKAAYFELSCGHYGTRETDELMKNWRTNRNLHYCDTCNNWKKVKARMKAAIPEEPLF